MFSGGRDSSLAALRLSAAGHPLTLVTVSADHLLGFERVRQRHAELEAKLPASTRWVRIRQPKTSAEFSGAIVLTCLPCQHDYAYSGAQIARQMGIDRLAFGYAKYQSEWPEQHPLATKALMTVLSDIGVKLELPVYDLASRADAISQLDKASLDVRALEQKCSRQIFNRPLEDAALEAHIAKWAEQLRKSLTQSVPIDVLEEGTLHGAMTRV